MQRVLERRVSAPTRYSTHWRRTKHMQRGLYALPHR